MHQAMATSGFMTSTRGMIIGSNHQGFIVLIPSNAPQPTRIVVEPDAVLARLLSLDSVLSQDLLLESNQRGFEARSAQRIGALDQPVVVVDEVERARA